jgi:hypothetical protein
VALSVTEWSFFVTEGALKRLQPNMGYDDASLLRAFDDNRGAIHIATVKAYRGSMSSGPPIFDEIFRRSAQYVCHREKGLSQLTVDDPMGEHSKRKKSMCHQ